MLGDLTVGGALRHENDPYEIGGVFARCRLSLWEIIKANPVLIPAIR